MLELGLLWAWLPYINFFGRDKFGMSYWSFGFSLDVVAAASCMFYGVTGYVVTHTHTHTFSVHPLIIFTPACVSPLLT